jgi:hypothetical protein
MKKFKNFYDAWWFLEEHPMFKYYDNKRCKIEFGSFQESLNIYVTKVNPKTKRIDDNIKLNTKVEIWVECGGYIFDENFNNWISCHDIRLDCGGDTFEEAIIKLANLVLKFYGKNKKV